MKQSLESHSLNLEQGALKEGRPEKWFWTQRFSFLFASCFLTHLYFLILLYISLYIRLDNSYHSFVLCKTQWISYLPSLPRPLLFPSLPFVLQNIKPRVLRMHPNPTTYMYMYMYMYTYVYIMYENHFILQVFIIWGHCGGQPVLSFRLEDSENEIQVIKLGGHVLLQVEPSCSPASQFSITLRIPSKVCYKAGEDGSVDKILTRQV